VLWDLLKTLAIASIIYIRRNGELEWQYHE